MSLKKNLLFINLLFKFGSLRNKISNSEVITAVNPNIVNKSFTSLWFLFKKKMTRNIIIFNLWASFAYIKTSLFHQATYVIVDHLKLIYTRMPKAASTFIAYEMMRKIDPTLPPSFSDKQINQISPYYTTLSIPNKKLNFVSFSTVRNPFHRIVAVYREFFNPNAPGNFIYENYLFGILKKDMSFKEFIDTIDFIPDFLKDRHFKPQSFILKEVREKTEVQIFKLEDDSEMLQAFLEEFGLSMPQQEQNSKSYDYRFYYDMAIAQKVRNIYFQDIKDFAYENIWENLVNSIKTRRANG